MQPETLLLITVAGLAINNVISLLREVLEPKYIIIKEKNR